MIKFTQELCEIIYIQSVLLGVKFVDSLQTARALHELVYLILKWVNLVFSN